MNDNKSTKPLEVQVPEPMDSLESADASVPLSSYASIPSPSNYATQSDLEVHSYTPKTNVVTQEPTHTPFSKRKALMVSVVITGLVVLLTGASALFLGKNAPKDSEKARLNVPVQDIGLEDQTMAALPSELQGTKEAFLVTTDIITRGELKFSNNSFVTVLRPANLSANQTFNLPDASGTLCLDSNNCGFAQQAQITQLNNQIAALTQQLGQVIVPSVPPSTLVNNQAGAVTIQGTTNQITVTTSNGTITLATAQDLASTSSPTFSGLLLNGNLTVNGSINTSLNCTTFLNGGSLTTDASGQIICADDETSGGGTSVTTPGGTAGVIPVFVAADQIGDSLISQALGTITITGNSVVTGSLAANSLSLTTALSVGNGGTGATSAAGARTNLGAAASGANGDITSLTGLTTALSVGQGGTGANTFTANGLLIGNGTGSLASTNAAANGQILLGNGTTPTFTTISGDIAITGLGATTIQADSVALGVDTTGNYVADISVGNGLSVSGGGSEGATPTVSLNIQANKGLEVDANGLSLIDCGLNQVLKYNGSNQWACAADTDTDTTGSFNLNADSGTPETVSNGDTLTITGGNNITTSVGATDTVTVGTVNNPNFTTSVTTPLLQSSGALSITPGGALTVGSTGQTALLQGSTTTITSSAGNNIVLTRGAGGQIQLTGFNCTGNANGGVLTTDASGNISCADDNGDAASGITGSGNANRLAMFTGGQTIADSWLLQNGSTLELDANRSLSISGSGGLIIGGDTINDFVGTGLQLSTGTLQTTLGTSVDLTSEVTGILPVGNGGTGVNGTTAANGTLLIGNGSGYTLATLTAGSGITVNNSSGGIEVVNVFGTSIESGEIIDLTITNGDIANGTINLSTKTTGNYVATVSGSSQIDVSGSGSNNAAVTLSLIADSIGNAQLEFDTGQALTTTSSPSFNGLTLSGNLAVSGGTVSAGTAAQAGSLTLSDGSNNTGAIQTASLGQNTTFTLPDPGQATANICLSTGNCAGSGGGVTTAGGNANRIALFNGAQTIADSWLLQNGSTMQLDNTRNLELLGGNLTLTSGNLSVAGNQTTSGTVTFSALANGFLETNGSGLVSVGTIDLGGDTAGNYVATITAGNGISGSSATEGGTPTIALGNLSANWVQGGAFDIVLGDAGAELRILESIGGTYYGTFDVGDLSQDEAYTFLQGGTVVTSGNVSSFATTGVAAGSGLTGGGTTGALTLDIGAGNGITVNANDIAVIYGSAANTAVQGNTSITVTAGTNLGGGGSITLGAGGTVTLNVDDSPTFAGTVTVQGASVSIGTASTTTGSLDLYNASSAFAGSVRVANLGQATIYTLPDPGAGSASICLSTGNCAGSGGGVTTTGGTTNAIAKFNGAQSLADSTLSDDGTNVTTTVDLIVQGGAVSIGTALQDAALTLYGNGFTATIDSAALTGNATFNLPDGSGEFCIKEVGNCSGAGGGNAPNSAQYLTLALDAGLTAERTLSFNSTNFSVLDGGANGSYTVNTAQNIDTASAPSFAGLTLTGNLNLNANTLQGGAAVIDFTSFDVASNGNVTAGTYNGQTISSSASLTGTLSVANLTTLNGGLTVEAGDTITFNGDAFTDFTGNGLQVSSNVLTLMVQTNKGLEVDSNGLSLIDCVSGEILKYNGSNQWACSSDGTGADGDSVSVNGSAATDVNFINVTATGTTAGTSWSLATGANPDEITLTVSNASATEAGVITTGTQTFAGDKTFNGSVVLAAQQTITMVGGTTAQRPASPTEGMLYFDTDTDTLLIYAGGKWQADRTESIIVAASNSTQAQKDSADYVADGTTDQTEINAALTEATGGKVYLLPGTYNVLGSISVPSNTTLSGSGSGSIIKIADANAAFFDVIVNSDPIGGNTNIVLRDFTLDGNRDVQFFNGNGIYFTKVGSGSGVTGVPGSVISGLRIQNFDDAGIYLDTSNNNNITNNIMRNNSFGTVWLDTSVFNTISENTVINSNADAFYIDSSPSNTITDNQITGSGGYGIYLFFSPDSIVNSNMLDDTSTGIYNQSSNGTVITGNVIRTTRFYGMELSGNYLTVSNNTTDNTALAGAWANISHSSITGNTFTDSLDKGFELASGSNNTVTANTIINSALEGMYFSSSNNNTISSNIITNSGGTGSTSGLRLASSDSNIVTNNRITDTAGTGQAINISNAASDANYLADNVYSGTGASSINDASGGDTIYGGQLNGSGNYVIEANAGSIELQSNTNVTGTLVVSGLITANGGLTVETGDTFTVNGDAFTDLTGNGLTVTSSALTLSLQANKGLEVDSNGLSFIDCSDGQVLKYNASNQWACAADAGGTGVGDSISVNGSAADDANFINTTASGTSTGVTISLNTGATPDAISVTIGNASATEAGSVTTGTQTFAGDKTFSNQIIANDSISVLQGSGNVYLTSNLTNAELLLANDPSWTSKGYVLGQYGANASEILDGMFNSATGGFWGSKYFDWYRMEHGLMYDYAIGLSSGGTGLTYRDGEIDFTGYGTKIATFDADSSSLDFIPDEPNIQNVTCSTTGGSMAAGTYYFRISYIHDGIHRSFSDSVGCNIPSGSTGSVTINYSGVDGASGYRVWRMDCEGCTAGRYFPDSGSPYVWTSDSGATNAGMYDDLNSVHSRISGHTDSFVTGGNFGIGDVDPDFRLEVKGSAPNGYFGITNVTDGDIFSINSSGNATFGGSVTIAAQQTITMVGGTTAQRPASPTEGMLFYDTTTKQLLTYSNGKWQSDRTEAVIVAASNSTQAQKDAADLVTDGTADQVEINSALTAGTGGKVFLLGGTYIINGPILLPSNTTLTGAGEGTIITITNALNTSFNLIENSDRTNGNTNITLSNLQINGNQTNQTAGIRDIINLSKVGSGTISSPVSGIRIEGILTRSPGDDTLSFNEVNHSVITGNKLHDAPALIFYENNNHNVINGNTFTNGYMYVDNSKSNVISNNTVGTIDFWSNSDNSVISDNIVNGGIFINGSIKTTITGNNAVSIQTAGNNTTISSNVIVGQGTNLSAIWVGSNNNTVIGNTILNSTYTSIFLENSSNNIISSNVVTDGGGSNNYDGIRISNNSDNNQITNNRITDTAGTGFAINIVSAVSDNTYLSNNTYSGTGASTINDAGTGTIYGGQLTPAQILQSGSSVIKANASSTISGTGAVTSGSATVTGTGTLFTTQLQVGDRITINGETKTVTAIGTATSLTVDTNYAATVTGQAVTRLPASLKVTSSTGSTQFIVADNGYVGIGTNTPQSQFHVAGGRITLGGPVAGEYAHIDGTGSSFTFSQRAGLVTFRDSLSGRNGFVIDPGNGAAILGNGEWSATPFAGLLQATGGLGTDIAGANLNIAGGRGTGTGVGGNIVFQYAPAGSTGSTANVLQTACTISGTNGSLSCPGSGTDSERFGANSQASGIQSLAVGINANASATSATAIGVNSSSGSQSVALGRAASATSDAVSIGFNSAATNNAIAIGGSSSASFDNSIAIGRQSVTTATNQLVVGSVNLGINQGYFGNGVTAASPQGFTLNASGGSGTDIQGASLTFAGGRGTGTGAGGSVNFQTSASGSTGATLNSLSTVFSLQGGTGAATFQNSTNSTTAFRILNAGGTPIMNVDTTNTRVLFGEQATVYGTAQYGFKGSLALADNAEIFRVEGKNFGGSGPRALVVDNEGLTYATGGLVVSPRRSESSAAALLIQDFTNGMTAPLLQIDTRHQAGSGAYNMLTVDGTSGTLYLDQVNGGVSAAADRFAIKAVGSQTGNLINLQNASGVTVSGFNAAGNLFYRNSGFISTITTGALGANRTLTIPGGSVNDTFCLQTLQNCSGTATTLEQSYLADVDGSNAVINLTSADGGILFRDNATPLGSTLFAVQNSAATHNYLGVTAGQVTFTGVNQNTQQTIGVIQATNLSGQLKAINFNLTADPVNPEALISTSAGVPLSFSAGSQTAQLTVTTGGSLGIGTNTPDYFFDLEKSQDGPVIARIYNTRNGGNDTSGLYLGTNAGATQFQLTAHNGGGGTSGSLGGPNSVNFNNTADGDLAFLTNNTMRLILDNSNNAYFGNGVTSATPASFTLNATGGSGTNITGADLLFAGGRGTGTGAGGDIIFQTAGVSGSGATLNTLSERMRITSTGVVVAANQSLTITGGTTANRPASPTEGMIFFDTSTKQLLTYANGKWSADSGEYIIVAASNSSQAIRDAADYVADGNTGAAADGDQIQIIQAITAAAGGKVYLAGGTYTIDAAITLASNTTLIGAGAASIITLPNAFSTNINMIDMASDDRVTLKDFVIDGNKANQTAGTMYGIYANNTDDALIDGLTIKNMRTDGVFAEEPGLDNSRIINSIITANTGVGIFFGYQQSQNNIIKGNTISSNGSHGIRAIYGADSNVISENNISNNAGTGISLDFGGGGGTISNNIIASNNAGINLEGANNIVVDGNTITNSTGSAIVLGGSGHTISNNTILNSGSSAIIIAGGDNSLIAGNTINGVASGAYGIHFSTFSGQSTGNTISNNVFMDGGDAAGALNLSDQPSNDSVNTVVNDNRFNGFAIVGTGTNTIYGGQQTSATNFALQGVGNVSIGTLTSDAKLEVLTTDTTTAANTIKGYELTVTDTGVVTTGTDNTYGQRIVVSRTGATGGTINTYGLDIQATGDGGGTSTLTGLNVNVSGADTNYAAIFQGGNVGVGTASPTAARLQVVGSGSGFVNSASFAANPGSTGSNQANQVILNNLHATNTKNQIMFQGNSVAKWSIGNDSAGNGTQDFFIFDETGGGTRLGINSSGQVSLGNLAAYSALDIANSNGDIRLYDTDAVAINHGYVIDQHSTGDLSFRILNTSDVVSSQYVLSLGADGSAGFNNIVDSVTGFRIFDADGGTSIFNVDTINERVGISDDSPDYKYEIQGTSGTGYLGITNSSDGDILSVTSTGVLKVATTAAETLTNAKLLVTSAEVTTALRIGTATDGVSFNDQTSNKLRLRGTARNDVTVALRPEFEGATFRADGSNNVGVLNSGYCSNEGSLTINTSVCATSGDDHSYYEWNHSEATAQDYDIVVRYKLPSDFDSGTLDTGSMTIYGWRTDATNNSVQVSMYNNAGALCGAAQEAAGTGGQWNALNFSFATNNAGCDAVDAGEYVTFVIKVTADQNDTVRIGEIELTYKSTY